MFIRIFAVLAAIATMLGLHGGTAGATTPAALTAASGARVFFGHQSVGENVLSGIPGVYSAAGLTAPPIVLSPRPDGGFIAHRFIGANGNPQSKISDFDRIIRGGWGDKLDVALMKLCYVDVTANTDVDALFASYRSTLDALQKDFPDVTFLHTTVPLTTDSPADNATRQQLNSLIRGTYGGRLFDLAGAESTTPSGAKVSGLYEGYASDPGHLNPAGSAAAASAFLDAVAKAV